LSQGVGSSIFGATNGSKKSEKYKPDDREQSVLNSCVVSALQHCSSADSADHTVPSQVYIFKHILIKLQKMKTVEYITLLIADYEFKYYLK